MKQKESSLHMKGQFLRLCIRYSVMRPCLSQQIKERMEAPCRRPLAIWSSSASFDTTQESIINPIDSVHIGHVLCTQLCIDDARPTTTTGILPGLEDSSERLSPAIPSAQYRPTRQMPQGSWFPGGIGLHGCPGIPLAMLVSKVSRRKGQWDWAK